MALADSALGDVAFAEWLLYFLWLGGRIRRLASAILLAATYA